ncbi:MAG: hypothetical protein C0402_04795 [Thermodesulfovibrio sp.]|nr:hypothetical protein [Thermodesulfovibrio sp.]
MSYKRVRLVLVFLLIAVMAVVVTGCAKKDAGVKDEDAIKAIQTTIEGNTKGNKLTSPIVILEKGAKKQTGEFPFKVEYTLTLADGSTKKEAVTYNISSGGVNDMGVAVWNAAEAK